MTDHDRADLAQLIRDLAVVHGEVTLASGRTASYYIDLRRVTLHHRAAPLIGAAMLDLIQSAGHGPSQVAAVGGLTMGADPVAAAMLHAAAGRDWPLDAFVVRKEAKHHGLQRRIEGPDVAGRPVVIVEDTSTTGGSALTALDAVLGAGGTPVAVAVIVDRDTGARERVEERGVPYLALFGKADLGLPER